MLIKGAGTERFRKGVYWAMVTNQNDTKTEVDIIVLRQKFEMTDKLI